MRGGFTVLTATLVLAFAAGCGSSGSGDGTASSTTPEASASAPRSPSSPSTPATPSSPSPSAKPTPRSRIPLRSDGKPADAVSSRVIKKWLSALSHGQVHRAARFFSLPSSVENGGGIVSLDSAAKRLVFNAAFPCGARATKLEHAAKNFTIVDFILTDRTGSKCDGKGNTARAAIRVAEGHIVEWYRIPELPGGGTPPAPSPPKGGGDPAPGTQIA